MPGGGFPTATSRRPARVEEARVDDAALRLGLLRELLQGADALPPDRRRGLARQVCRDGVPARRQVPSHVVEAAPREDRALREAHHRDQGRGREREARSEAARDPVPEARDVVPHCPSPGRSNDHAGCAAAMRARDSGASAVSIPSRSQVADERWPAVHAPSAACRRGQLSDPATVRFLLCASSRRPPCRSVRVRSSFSPSPLLPTSCGYVTAPARRLADGAVGAPRRAPDGGLGVQPAGTRADRRARSRASSAGPVRVVDALPTATDDDTKALAERVVGQRSLRYDWREPRARADRAVLAGVTHDVDAVYRAVLEYSERERLATDAEWEELRAVRSRVPSPPRAADGARGGRRRERSPARRSCRRTRSRARSLYRRRVTLANDKERIDVAAAVADAVRGLGAGRRCPSGTGSLAAS